MLASLLPAKICYFSQPESKFPSMLNGDGVYRQGENCLTAVCPIGYGLEL